MSETLAGLLGAVIVGVLSLVANLILGQRRKTLAEAKASEGDNADKISQSAVRLTDRWELQVTRLEKRVADLERAGVEKDKEIARLTDQVERLTQQNLELAEQVGELERQLGLAERAGTG